MAIQKFDELNNFFSKMNLSKTERNKRIELAKCIAEVFDYIFLIIAEKLKRNEYIDTYDLISIAEVRFADAIGTYRKDLLTNYPELQNYPRQVVEQIITTTASHIVPIETLSDGIIVYGIDMPYMLSQDRIFTIAENEANTIGNAVELQDAIDYGYTTKTWRTMEDERVRDSHIAVDGQTIGINELFNVGGSQMPFPRAIEGSPEETVNCRCTLEYGY